MSRTRTLAFAILTLAAPCCLSARTNVYNVPLPQLTNILTRAVQAAQKEDYYEDVLNQRYCYERSRITDVHYSNGKFKDREEKYNTNSPAPETATLPLPPYIPSTEAEAASAQKKRNQLLDITELATNVLAHAQLAMVGREWLNGRATVMVDFQPPAKPVPENSIVDRLINRTAGRAWVDEQDFTVAKLEARLLQKLSIFGGIGGAVYSGTYAFERVRTSEGIWYASNIQYAGDIREFILYRTLSYREQYQKVHKPTPPVTTR